MDSSKTPDRSLGSGISFPQWIKGKVDTRFDFDPSTFSPPAHDDNFFHISYRKPINSLPKITKQDGYQSINAVLSDKGTNNNATASGSHTEIRKTKNVEHIDFSKHPIPCQPFVPLVDIKGQEKNTVSNGNRSVGKSQGIDDGFHGEPARCGKSIVHVANRIISGALSKKIYQIQSDEQMERSTELKVGSKSLPVSPITTPISTPDSSPKLRRRAQGNRFFTGAFIPDRDKYPGGWLLTSILSQSREIVNNKIDEEDETIDSVKSKNLSRKKSISSQNLTYIGKEQVAQTKINTSSNTSTFQGEPSEFREMNFWSPTSM